MGQVLLKRTTIESDVACTRKPNEIDSTSTVLHALLNLATRCNLNLCPGVREPQPQAPILCGTRALTQVNIGKKAASTGETGVSAGTALVGLRPFGRANSWMKEVHLQG
jgi:hypothetical protein